MIPAPPSIANTPRKRSRPCWNPAVPPPPVAGAAAGATVGLGDGVGARVVGVGVSVGETAAVAVAVAVAVLVGDPVDVAVAVPEGEDVGSPTGGEDPPVQAEIAAEATRATMPQLTAVNLALSLVPAAVVRAFMEPPHASGRLRSRFRMHRGP